MGPHYRVNIGPDRAARPPLPPVRAGVQLIARTPSTCRRLIFAICSRYGEEYIVSLQATVKTKTLEMGRMQR